MLAVAILCAALHPFPVLPQGVVGSYRLAAFPDLRVSVLDTGRARVTWHDGASDVDYLHGLGVRLRDPLASRARQAGVVVSRVRYDARTESLLVDFDGRMAFSLVLTPEA